MLRRFAKSVIRVLRRKVVPSQLSLLEVPVSSLLEIVELMSGEIVLQRADGEGEPLLELRFSDEAAQMLGEAQVEVARAMIHAGIEVVAESQVNRSSTGSLEGATVDAEETSSEVSAALDSTITVMQREDSEESDQPDDSRSGKYGMDDGVKASDLASNRVLH